MKKGSGNHLILNLFIILIMAAGVYSFFTINRESYPHVVRGEMRVTTYYPGASPQEVEVNVTIPLEKAVGGTMGVREYTSSSFQNYSVIYIHLDEGLADMEKVKNDIRRAVDGVSLPAEVTRKPHIWEYKVTEFSFTDLGVYSTTLPYGEVRTRARDIKRRIEAIPEIAKVDELGVLEREVHIELDQGLLDKYYISIDQVIQVLKERNISITGGIYSKDNMDRTISVSARLTDLKDVGRLIVSTSFDGPKVQLRDLGRISRGFSDEIERHKLDGNKTILLRIKKRANADVIDTMTLLKEVIADYSASAGDLDLHMKFVRDMSYDTRNRLDIVFNNALIGLVLVVIVLFIFMNFENAFWAAAGIPFSIAFALIFFQIFGITVNAVSLLGIIVVLGIIVDDSIIISENIYRHRIAGLPLKEACVVGVKEVLWPVITTVATTIVAFVPLLMMKGMLGDFSKEIPIVVILVLCGSLVECLLVLPMHLSYGLFSRGGRDPVRDKKFISALKLKYRKLLTFVLAHYRKALLVGLLLCVGSVLLWRYVLRFENFPTADTNAVFIYGKTVGGKSLDYTDQLIGPLEERLGSYPTNIVLSSYASIGGGGNPEKFHISIRLSPPNTRKVQADSIIAALKDITSDTNRYKDVFYIKMSGGPWEGRDIRLDVVGNDNDKRRELSDRLETWLTSRIAGVHGIIRSDVQNRPELQVVIDQEKTARMGISSLAIGRTIRTAYAGVIATDIQEPEEKISFRVKLDSKSRQDISRIGELRVLNRQRRLIPLRDLVRIIETNAVDRITHYKGDRTTYFEADIDREITTPNAVYSLIREEFKNFEKEHPGFRLVIGGEAKASREGIVRIQFAAFLAISIIFFILIVLFKSISQSLVVLLAVPFSVVGLVCAALSHNMSLSYFALFGMVGLTGVVVNDSLVMVNFLNNMKEQYGEGNIIEMIIEGAVTRLRPVMLTTITTIAGLIPTAYGLGGEDPVIKPTTIVMAWGLFFSTMLVLTLVPAMYLLEHRARNFVAGIFSRIWRRAEK